MTSPVSSHTVGPSSCPVRRAAASRPLAIAGVAARIDEQLLAGLDGWRCMILRPAVDHASLRPVEAGANEDDDGTGTVLVVDQLEELLRLEDDERHEFCGAWPRS